MPNLFTYNPDATDAPLAKGRHEAEILAAETRTSRAGNPMLDVTYRVHGPVGDVLLKDYLVSTPRAKWKIKRFCQTLGLDFEKGEIDPAPLPGRRLGIEVGVEDDGQGRDRNVITDYGQAFAFSENGGGGAGSGGPNGHGKTNGHGGGHGAGNGAPPTPTIKRQTGRTGGRLEGLLPKGGEGAADDEGHEIPF